MRTRRRYPLAVLLVLLVALVVSMALTASAMALPTFTAPPSPQTTPATPACATCHGSAGPSSATPGLHAFSTHSATACSVCHTVSTATPPTPGQCAGCHNPISAVIAENTHSTLGCGSAPPCHGAPVVTAKITAINPAKAPVGTTVTITGTGFGATKGTGKVTFGMTAATVTTWSATKIVTKVPAGLTVGAVNVVVTPGTGTASAPFSFTVTQAVKTTLTLKLVGVKSGILKFGRTVTAKGLVKPFHAAKVTIKFQRKVATKWVTMKKVTRVSNATTGVYSFKYKPGKKGTWRAMSSVAKVTVGTNTYSTAKTLWKTFKVK